nr:polysaccharide pyruvyl transferase family protein [Desulfobacula sp.]
MGCNALTYSAILLLEEIAKSLKLNFNYILFKDIHAQSLLIYSNLDENKIKCVPPVITTRTKFRAMLKRQSASIKHFNKSLSNCDVFFEIAGGDSFSDIYGIQRPALFERYHSRIKEGRKPLIFLPQTIGPFNSNRAKKIAANSLSYATHVFARDPISYEKAVEFAKRECVSRTIDMAFFMNYMPNKSKHSQLFVGVNPSGLLWNGGYTGTNQFGLKADYQKLISKTIEKLHQENCKVIIVPHVLDGPTYHIEDDYRVGKLLVNKYPFCGLAPFFYSPVEAKSFISGLDLMIGSRMHCCIAGYSSGVPIYPLAYSRKFKGLFKEELDYPYGAELQTDDIETVINGLENFLRNLTDIQASMTKRLESLVSYKCKFIDKLTHLIQSHIQPG